MLTLNCFFEITLVLRAEINPGKAALVPFVLLISFFVRVLKFFILFYFGKQILAFQIGLPILCVHNGKPPVLQPFPQDKKTRQTEIFSQMHSCVQGYCA